MIIRIIIADDHPIVREGLKRIIQEQSDMQFVGEAADGYEAVKVCAETEADVLLLDISMPGPGFLETLDKLRLKHPDLQILVLSINPENHYAVRAIKAGAAGYLNKNHTPEELAKAIRTVYNGQKYITPALATELTSELRGESHNDLQALSKREYQVLCMLGAGKQVAEISDKLSLSPKTVSTYRTRILEKLDLDSTAEIIRFVVENEIKE